MNTRILKLLLALVALSALESAAGTVDSGFAIVENGKARCSIVATGNKQVDEDVAFFTNAVFRMSGIEVKVGGQVEKDENVITFDIRETNLFYEDDYEIVFPDAQTLKIVGTDTSCRWALNALLEEQGAVFCFPGKHGTHYPAKKTVSVARCGKDGREIVRRGQAGLQLQRTLWAGDRAWERCLNGKTYRGKFSNHALYDIFPRSKYFSDEWVAKLMPMKNGVRRRPTGTSGDKDKGWQPCFASQEGVDEAVKNICERLEKDPSLKVISLSINDEDGYCECPGCREMNGGSFDRRPRFGTAQNRDHSPSYFTWVNKVVEGVTKRYPKIVFGCLAYCGTIDPPPFKLHPAVVAAVCQDLSKLRDEKECVRRVELMNAWREKATAFSFDDYGYGCRHYAIPRLYTDLQQKFFALKSEFPCFQGYFCEGSSFIGEGYKRYLYYRFMWDPHLDPEAEIVKWCRGCVGDEAAPFLRDYYLIWENFWKSDSLLKTNWYRNGLKGLYFDFDTRDYVFALDRKDLDRATTLMDAVVAAAKRTGDADQRDRARRLSHFHDYYRNIIVSCGAFHSRPDGTFASAEQAADFVRDLGTIGRATREAERAADVVCSDKYAEQGVDHMSRYACDCLKTNMAKSPLPLLFNSLLDHFDAPVVKAALAETARNPDVDPERARLLKGLANLEKLPNLTLRESPAEDLRGWNRYKGHGVKVTAEPGGERRWRLTCATKDWSAADKIILKLEKSRNYLFSARLTNPLSRSIDVDQIFSSQHDDQPNGELGNGGGNNTSRRFVVKPGETVQLRVFGKTSPKCAGAHLYVVPSIRLGESVLLEDVSLVDLEADVPSPAADFAVVENGKARCLIVATGNKQVDEDIVFFTNAVARMAGVGIEVEKRGGERTGNRIVFDLRETDLFHEDDYEIVFPDAQTLKIVGTDTSCRWALNRILEENGVVFCFPGPRGTHWPARKTVSVARTSVSDTAGLKLLRQMWAEDLAWERCLNGKTYRGNFQNHSMFHIFPKEKYFSDEWVAKLMPMKEGVRRRPVGTRWNMGWQPCFASQEGVNEAVKNICAFFEKDPALKVFSLSVNDLEGYCECPECLKLNGGSFDRRPTFGTGQNRDHSPSYYTWANKVAEGVTKRFPKAVFGCLAYCGTIDPPPFKLHPSIVPFLCQDLSKTRDEKEFARRIELIRAWQEKATAICFWDYGYGCRSYVVPRLYTDLQEKFFALKKDLPHIQGYFCEGSSFIGEGPKRYLYYRYMWNPQLDPERETEKWCRACVGEEAAPMLREYYRIWENFWKSDALLQTHWYRDGLKGLYFSFDTKDYVFALGRKDMDRATELMKEVVAAAERTGDADQRNRAQRLSHFHDYYRNRVVSCGAFHCRPDGTFASAEQAAGFVRDLGTIGRATREAERAADVVCDDKLTDQGDDKFAQWSCERFKTFLAKTSMPVLFNSLLDYFDAPVVRQAIAEVSHDSDLDSERAHILRGLSNLEKLPNLTLRDSPAEDLRGWNRVKGYGVKVTAEPGGERRWRLSHTTNGWTTAGKIILNLKKSRNYLYSARVTNPLAREIHVQQIFSSQHDDLPNGEVGMGGGHETERRYVVKPGETVQMRVFGKTSVFCAGVRLYVVPSIRSGESVLLEDVSLVDLEEDPCSAR